MSKLDHLFAEIFKLLNREVNLSSVSPISAWSVQEHIEHILRVAEHILVLILSGKTVEFKPLSFRGRFVLLSGYIPRGVGRSPEAMLPTGVSLPDLHILLKKTQTFLAQFQKMRAELPINDQVFAHPFFGLLNRSQALRFIEIHSRHHLKIIYEILKHNKSK